MEPAGDALACEHYRGRGVGGGLFKHGRGKTDNHAVTARGDGIPPEVPYQIK